MNRSGRASTSLETLLSTSFHHHILIGNLSLVPQFFLDPDVDTGAEEAVLGSTDPEGAASREN